MKKICLLLILIVAFVSCGNGPKNIDIKQADSATISVSIDEYGIFNQDNENPQVKYKIVAGNVVLSVIFCETVIVPVWLVGWHLWEPVCNKREWIPGKNYD